MSRVDLGAGLQKGFSSGHESGRETREARAESINDHHAIDGLLLTL
jgi:hypothetical protein